ncbi:NADAR family protein [Pseudomonas sp. F1_0610]|uniref:NADAR family protein n=1 Tax=Pseudomonas sp. F1_0610 TaxID=3114284 RepID=UPI0039C213B7
MSKKTFTIDNPMPPLWLRLPGLSRFSIGWRMGYGEDYRYQWGDWYMSLSKEDQQQYQIVFPEPAMWAGYYAEDEKAEDEEWVDPDNVHGYLTWQKGGVLKYNRSQLIKQGKVFTEEDLICFWKPEPYVVNKACLGQWQPSVFSVDADQYSCAEQYMMAEKARLFDDETMRQKIMQATAPKAMKAFGQKVQNFDQTVWDETKATLILEGNYHKFSQNPQMMAFLLATGDKILVEASLLDRIWGVGLAQDNEKILNPRTWQGDNLLGFALMEVRDELRRVYANYDKIDWSKFT